MDEPSTVCAVSAHQLRRFSRMDRPLPVLTLAVVVAACAPSDERPQASQINNDPQNVVEVVARGLTLEAPEEIPSGWTTFRFRNESPMIHFALIERVPEGQGIESQQAEIAPVFQEGMDLLGTGDVDAALEKFGELPGWFGEIVFLGGPGLTSANQTSQATVYLEPGTYLLECYVKTNGVFHSYNPDPSVYGMVHEFQVTAQTVETAEPTATLWIAVSSSGGIEMTGTPTPGEHTVAVYFADQTVHENFVGHDVHLVRVTDDLDLVELEQWMDWRQPKGLQTPAPAVFLGGLNEMPAGTTGYFTVTLDEGNYAWVSEVAGSKGKGMLVQFYVGSGAG
jgi:hypothetical protein